MKKNKISRMQGLIAAGFLVWSVGGSIAQAGNMVQGIPGDSVQLTAKDGYIVTPDGGSIYTWGYANGAGLMQYPGPTIIATVGDTVSVTLNNTLPEPVSIVFPGQENVTASGGTPGVLTQEAITGGDAVTYTFTVNHPGTYVYYSGTHPDLQVEMGLVGALIVRPSVATQAYEHADTSFDHEYLFLCTEMDEPLHKLVEENRMAEVDTAAFYPSYWFLNGRCAPDTMDEPNVSWLPHQPYNCMPMMQPGQKILLRMIGGGRDLHPFHTHGNNEWIIARDGRLFESTPGAGPDLAVSDFTIDVIPGGTADAIFEWTGEQLGWDIYGHVPGDDMMPNEYAPDHGKPFPVVLPGPQELTYGSMYSGSPFLAGTGALPPGEGGFNPMGAYTYMWHSHNEKEMTNYDIFPGGMMTMLMIMGPDMPMMMP